VAGAKVATTAGAATFTDSEGNFTLQNVELDADAGFVKVEKAGYFSGSRTFMTAAGQNIAVTISLIAKSVTGSFDAASGGKVTLSRGSVSLPAAGVMKADSTPYSGTVSVSSYYIDPTSPTVSEIMPGDLRGITTDGEQRGLKSFAMMAVELEGAAGEKLQIAPGKEAILTFAIPVSLQAEAPATIPLWYFDEVKGLWQEQGTAIRQGSSYVGTVSHFSFWNCDAPFSVVTIEALLKDGAGGALPFAPVTIVQLKDSMVRSGRTDAAGRLIAQVPAGEPLELLVKANECSESYFRKPIGPYASRTNLGEVATAVDQVALRQVTITGRVELCDGSPMTNGYVKIYHEGAHDVCVPLNADGSYSFPATFCPQMGQAVEITAIENSLERNFGSMPVEVPAGVSTFDAGTLRVDCSPERGWWRLDLENKQHVLKDSPDYLRVSTYTASGQARTKIYGGYTFILCETELTRISSDLIVAGTIDKVGSYPVIDSKFFMGLPSSPNSLTRYTFSGGQLQVSAYEERVNPEGGTEFYVSGTYSGTVLKGGSQVPFTISFNAIRQF
jgi:hypothetical protein